MERTTRVVSGPLAHKMQRLAAGARGRGRGRDHFAVAARCASGGRLYTSRNCRGLAAGDPHRARPRRLQRHTESDMPARHGARRSADAYLRLARRRVTRQRSARTPGRLCAHRRKGSLELFPPGGPRAAGPSQLGGWRGSPTLHSCLGGLSSAVCPTWMPSGDPWSPPSPNKRPSHGRPFGEADRNWFTGTLRAPPATAHTKTEAFVCAESPRRGRRGAPMGSRPDGLGDSSRGDRHRGAKPLTSGMKRMLVLTRTAGLPVHFTHGVAALESADGQACAALADVLLRGISQVRVRRLLRRSPVARAKLPSDWARGLHRSAGLFTLTQWTTALEAGAPWAQIRRSCRTGTAAQARAAC